MRLLTYGAAIVLVASLTVGIVAPVHGFDFAGNFRGVFPQKNVMGGYAASAILVVIGRLLHRRLIGTLATIGVGILGCIAVTCLGLANSVSVVPVLLSALIALLLARLIRLSDGAGLALVVPIAVCGATGAGFVLYGNWASLVELLGRDPDMSG
jgi:O-antigen ligase